MERLRSGPITETASAGDRLAILMKSAQAGDAAAYTALMEDLAPRLRGIVRRHRGVLAREDVEDLVQDILLSLHSVRATYDPARPFMPWILAITRNRLVDSARRYARTSAYEVTVEDLAVTFSNVRANNPSDDVHDPAVLKQAIGELPPGQRSAIELLKLRELSLKEAAAETGTSIGALKVATHRAMAALRKRLRGE